MIDASSSRLPPLLRDDVLGRLPGLVHGFTTRSSDVSSTEGAASALGLDWPVAATRQVHGARCHLVGGASRGGTVEADALATATPGVLLAVRTADCLPLLVAATAGSAGGPTAVAAVHAGWRGLLAGVVAAAVERLRALVPGPPLLVAAPGPAIGPCCFEVGDEVAGPFAARFGPEVIRRPPAGRPRVDLLESARRELTHLGVAVSPGVPPCTRCRPDQLHSHRADGAAAGRNLSVVGFRR